MRPRLKSISVIRNGAGVVLYRRALQRVYLDDETGSVAELLQVLATGRHTVAELPAALRERGVEVTGPEVSAAIAALDEVGVLERADTDEGVDPGVRQRHESNLRYYDLYSDVRRTSADFQRSVAGARVLLLGAGGLGSGVLQSLVGLGVGGVRVVDFDTVEEKNLARQFAYDRSALGRRKVDAARDWVARYSPATAIEAVHERVADADAIRRLGAGTDLVVLAVDEPEDIPLLANEACFDLGVPFVTGGLQISTLFYWSVQPGVTPCRLCLELNRRNELADDGLLAQERLVRAGRVNRVCGPVAQLLCGFVALEALRYLARHDPPVAGAVYHTLDVADGMRYEREPWSRHPDCPLCTVATPPGRQA